MGTWQPFFSAEVGASAALAGLIFVGVSINLSTIMKYPGLPNRALEGLLVLLLIMLVATVMLVPEQNHGFQGGEVSLLSVVGWLVLTVMYAREFPHVEPQYRRAALPGIIMSQLAVLLFFGAGIVLFIAGGAGAYVLMAAVVCSFVLAFFDAWILLIEINR